MPGLKSTPGHRRLRGRRAIRGFRVSGPTLGHPGCRVSRPPQPSLRGLRTDPDYRRLRSMRTIPAIGGCGLSGPSRPSEAAGSRDAERSPAQHAGRGIRGRLCPRLCTPRPFSPAAGLGHHSHFLYGSPSLRPQPARAEGGGAPRLPPRPRGRWVGLRRPRRPRRPAALLTCM